MDYRKNYIKELNQQILENSEQYFLMQQSYESTIKVPLFSVQHIFSNFIFKKKILQSNRRFYEKSSTESDEGFAQMRESYEEVIKGINANNAKLTARLEQSDKQRSEFEFQFQEENVKVTDLRAQFNELQYQMGQKSDELATLK